jgi:hypothetical protein
MRSAAAGFLRGGDIASVRAKRAALDPRHHLVRNGADARPLSLAKAPLDPWANYPWFVCVTRSLRQATDAARRNE